MKGSSHNWRLHLQSIYPTVDLNPNAERTATTRQMTQSLKISERLDRAFHKKGYESSQQTGIGASLVIREIQLKPQCKASAPQKQRVKVKKTDVTS